MSLTKQAVKSLRRSVTNKLLDREMTRSDLAKLLGHDLSVISKAINHGRFPRVRAKILEALV